MCSPYQSPHDTQDLDVAKLKKARVDAIVAKRQQIGAPWLYRVLTPAAAAAALVVWVLIYANTTHNPEAPVDRGYASFLTLAAVMSFTAVMLGLAWLREHDASRNRAQADLIREQQHARQVRSLRDAIGVFLRDGDDEARQIMAHTQQIVNGRSDGVVSQFRGRAR